jgi:hypothetical protein
MVRFACCECEPDSQTCRIDNRMNLAGETASRPAYGLSPVACDACRMLMHSHYGRVGQFVAHVSKLRLGGLSHDPAIGLNSVSGGQDMSALEGEPEIFCSPRALPGLTDAVEEVANAMGAALHFEHLRVSIDPVFTSPAGGSAGVQRLVDFGRHAHTTRAAAMFGGGRQMRIASVLRFCTIAARWNSSRAPESPLSRMRSKR